MVINHSITVPSASGAPNPSGFSADPNFPCPTSSNPLICQYTCTECGKDIWIYWDGQYFSLTGGEVWPDAGPNNTSVSTPDEVDDMTFGALDINYNPPI